MSAKIWLIDDDPINHLICSTMIAKAGLDAEVESFYSAEAALEALQKPDLRPDQILLDLHMSGMTGWEFLDRFQDLTLNELNQPAIPVTILSSSVMPNDIERARSHPAASGYLIKPLQAEALTSLPYITHAQNFPWAA